jgi:hypothetical protein
MHEDTSGKAAEVSLGDWRRVTKLWQQLRAVARPEAAEIDDYFLGTLAESLSRLMAYYEGREEVFVQDLFAIWAREAGVVADEDGFVSLYQDKALDEFAIYNPQDDRLRRLPTPFEASVETARRLQQLNRLEHLVRESVPCAAILGGSLSYGRCYNVKGSRRGDKSSDTDLLIVLPSWDLLPRMADSISQLMGVDQESANRLTERSRGFERKESNGGYRVFSHKLRLWTQQRDPLLEQYELDGEYTISIHVMDEVTFDYIVLRDLAILEESLLRQVDDYRDTEPQRPDELRSFSGRTEIVPLQDREIDSEWQSQLVVCQVNEERFYPGLHQCLILPQFEVRWEDRDLSLRLRVLAFRWKVHERLREERVRRPYELQTLSLAHPRHFVFSPHIIQRANRGTEL